MQYKKDDVVVLVEAGRSCEASRRFYLPHDIVTKAERAIKPGDIGRVTATTIDKGEELLLVKWKGARSPRCVRVSQVKPHTP